MLDQAIARAASLVTRTQPPQLFTEIGRHRRLFRAWLPFAGTLLFRGCLPRADAELVILRTAVNADCEYEWRQHVRMAARAGLSDDEIAAVRAGNDRTAWTDRQRVLLQSIEQLHANRRIDPSTRAALERHLSPAQLVELCFLVGHYEMLAMLLNTKEVAPDRLVSGPRGSDLGHWSVTAERRTLDP